MLGAAFIIGSTILLGLPVIPRGARWYLWGGAVTLGAMLLLWPHLLSEDPVAATRRLTAVLALSWALLSWLLRALNQESGRLSAEHPGVVVSQLLCLITAGYSIGMAVYFLVPQLALALVQTWSHTILLETEWVFTDLAGALDLFCVAAACIIATRATHSAMLLVPLFWTLFLALLWQCLLIPPVIYDPTRLSAQWTGRPSLWALATLVCSAALTASFVFVQGWSWQRSRALAWQKDTAFLLRPARSWPGLETTVLVSAVFVAFLGALLLVFPPSAGSFQGVLPVVAAALSSAAVAVCLFAVVHRHWRPGMAELGCGLMTLSICKMALLLVPKGPADLEHRFPLIFNALIVGCAVSASLWLWLSRVWQQQLFPDGSTWTTTGRMISVAKRAAFLPAALGIVFALRMGMWPLTMNISDASAGRLICGSAAMVLLAIVIVRGYLITGRPAYRSLMMLAVFSMFVFGMVRYLPYTPWH